MKRMLITVFLFGAALFGTATMATAHPGHGGGPGHIHGPSHFHPRNHRGVVIYRSSIVSPRTIFYPQPLIIRGGHLPHRGAGHLHGPHDHFHNHGGLIFRTGRIRFGIRY